MEYIRRKLIRIPGFDYSQACTYFVTICSDQKKCIFGHIVGTNMHLNQMGILVASCWKDLSKMYQSVLLDGWVLMPNHLHAIIWLNTNNSEKQRLERLIAAFKARSTSKARRVCDNNINLWQRSFFEHVIRDEDDLMRIRQYIVDNPAQWAVDRENPEANRSI